MNPGCSQKSLRSALQEHPRKNRICTAYRYLETRQQIILIVLIVPIAAAIAISAPIAFVLPVRVLCDGGPLRTYAIHAPQ